MQIDVLPLSANRARAGERGAAVCRNRTARKLHAQRRDVGRRFRHVRRGIETHRRHAVHGHAASGQRNRGVRFGEAAAELDVSVRLAADAATRVEPRRQRREICVRREVHVECRCPRQLANLSVGRQRALGKAHRQPTHAEVASVPGDASVDRLYCRLPILPRDPAGPRRDDAPGRVVAARGEFDRRGDVGARLRILPAELEIGHARLLDHDARQRAARAIAGRGGPVGPAVGRADERDARRVEGQVLQHNPAAEQNARRQADLDVADGEERLRLRGRCCECQVGEVEPQRREVVVEDGCVRDDAGAFEPAKDHPQHEPAGRRKVQRAVSEHEHPAQDAGDDLPPGACRTLRRFDIVGHGREALVRTVAHRSRGIEEAG